MAGRAKVADVMPIRASLGYYARLRLWARVSRQKALEFVRFESRIASICVCLYYLLEYGVRRLLQGSAAALLTAGKLFRHSQLPSCRRYAARLLRRSLDARGAAAVGANFRRHLLIDAAVTKRLRESVLAAERPFDRRLIILSEPRPGERGVMVVKFTENFKYLPQVFDLERLSMDYLLVLEPSFSGYFDEDILCLLGTCAPMIIQAPEQVDAEFLQSIDAGLHPVPLGANRWVDDRIFFPIAGCVKKYDVIVVALWADFKRHYCLFEALSRLARTNSVRVALVGAPWPRPKADIEDLARYYRVESQVEFFEKLPQSEVNRLINQSKIALLLSRKEGINKSIVEAMHANVPGFFLEGFNYGHRYSYVNEQTGGFVPPHRLAEFLADIDGLLSRERFAPADWVRSHLSVHASVGVLKDEITAVERRYGFKVNKQLVPKVNSPDCDYYHAHDWQRFAEQYRNLVHYLKAEQETNV